MTYSDKGARVADYLARFTVTQGRRYGEPFTVLPWQREFLIGAFAPGVNEAALSVARGNGKTALMGGVAAQAVLPDSPLHEPRAETCIVAASHDQGGILFDHMLAYLAPAIEADPRAFRVINNAARRRVEYRETGAVVRLLSSDFKRAHGLAPALVLLDEPAQWPASGDGMVAALRTARGKIPDSRIVSLGTRARSSTHWFNRRLDGGSGANIYVQSHHATDLDDFTNPEQWRLANPSLDHMPDLEAVIADEAREAEADPGALASFQALRLNGGVSDVANQDMLEDASRWRAALSREPMQREGRPVFGLDLGGAAAMSSVAACWRTGRLETLCMFGGDPDLATRAKRDGAGDLYSLAHGADELLVSGRRIPDVAELLDEAAQRFGEPAALVCDRWRLAELRDTLDAERWGAVRLITRGQGFKDGSDAVRAWRKHSIAGNIYPAGPCILLTAALGTAVTVSDPAGNEKLAKHREGGRRQNSRDDVVAAALLAVEYGLEKRPPEDTSLGVVL